jgi:threonine/homoserine efflux transporter RhtA
MRRSAPLLPLLVVGSLVAGLALMIPFEATITRILGVGLLFAFIAGGLFLIAEPTFLEGDRE